MTTPRKGRYGPFSVKLLQTALHGTKGVAVGGDHVGLGVGEAADIVEGHGLPPHILHISGVKAQQPVQLLGGRL